MNSYNYSYNVLIQRFNAFADGHYLIKRFTHGQIDLADMDNDEQYPFMHVTPDVIKPSNGAITFSFHVMFADIPRDKESKAEYQREVISDCVRLAQDLIGEIKNGLTLFGYDVQMANEPTLEPFMEEYKNTLTGIAFTIDLEVPYNYSACDIPANWSIGGSSTGGSGSAIGVTFKVNSVNNAVQNVLNLVAGSGITITDNGDGSVTFTSVGGGGGGSVSWGGITGTLSNQTDLQNALDAKANTSALGAVAFSDDYNDLINQPTIPAAQVNSDWNSVSGVSEILNKPNSLPPSGAAGGDLQGNYPNPIVHQVHSIEMQAGTPSTGDVWLYEGAPAKWQHQPLPAIHVTNDSAVTGASVKDALNHLNATKQETLVSGTNIKTVNSQTLVGSGNVSVGSVTSISGIGTTAGLSLSGTVTSSGNLILSGTLSTPISTINDSTTVGQNLVKLTNPSAVRFLRINADNTVSARTSAEMVTDLAITSASTSLLFQSQNATNIPSSSTYFGCLFGGALSIVSTDTLRRTPIATAGTLTRLFIQTSSAQPATGSLVCTVRKNSVDQALTLTIAAGSAAGVFTDLINSVSVAAGDFMGMKFQNNATTVSANVLSNQVILTI
jgi:hypothetical protein